MRSDINNFFCQSLLSSSYYRYDNKNRGKMFSITISTTSMNCLSTSIIVNRFILQKYSITYSQKTIFDHIFFFFTCLLTLYRILIGKMLNRRNCFRPSNWILLIGRWFIRCKNICKKLLPESIPNSIFVADINVDVICFIEIKIVKS